MLFYCERERGVNTVIGSANDAFLIPHSPMARFYWPSNVYKVFVLPFIYSSNGSNTYYNGQDSVLVLSVQKLRFSSPKFKQYTALDRKFPLWLVIVIPSLTLPYYLTRGNLLLVWGSESAEPESGARSRWLWSCVSVAGVSVTGGEASVHLPLQARPPVTGQDTAQGDTWGHDTDILTSGNT